MALIRAHCLWRLGQREEERLVEENQPPSTKMLCDLEDKRQNSPAEGAPTQHEEGVL